MRDIDRTVSEIPGLEGPTLVEDALDAAIARAERQPGYAGPVPPTRPAAEAELAGATVG